MTPARSRLRVGAATALIVAVTLSACASGMAPTATAATTSTTAARPAAASGPLTVTTGSADLSSGAGASVAPPVVAGTTAPPDPVSRRIVAATWSNPGRSDGTVIGLISRPPSPVLNHTRCETLPGSIATTRVDPANACSNNSGTLTSLADNIPTNVVRH